MKRKVTFVIPSLNEANGIPSLHEALSRISDDLSDRNFRSELIFVDNHSTDHTVDLISKLNFPKDVEVKLFVLNRNYGLQRSILFGTTKASGDCLIVFQSDLQDPPEAVLRMIENWVSGARVVAGVSNKRNERRLILFTSGLFYRFINLFTDIRIVRWFQDFFLLDRSVYEDLGRRINHYEFLRGRLVDEYGVDSFVFYERLPRKSGRSNYNFASRYSVAMDGITRYGTKIIRWLVITTFGFSLFSGLFLLISIVFKFTSIAPLLGGVQLWLFMTVSSVGLSFISLGLEFLSRILKLSSNLNTEIHFLEVRRDS
jgi:glycosyltransferase involved in cell wall biosynthesis